MTSNRTQWYLVLGVGAGVIVAVLLTILLSAKPLQIAWHRHRLQELSVAVDRPNLTNDEATSIHLSLESHLERLVELRSVVKHEFRFKHLQSPTEESRHLWNRINSKDCPSRWYATSEFPTSPEPLVLLVWFDPEFADDWDRFIQTVDVADYQERFMRAPEE